MDSKQWLPLGSVVTVNEDMRKFLIVGRGLNIRAEDEGEPYYFDYACVRYPIGIQGDSLMYINHFDVDQVLFEGYDDDDNRIVGGFLTRFIDEHPNVRRYRS